MHPETTELFLPLTPDVLVVAELVGKIEHAGGTPTALYLSQKSGLDVVSILKEAPRFGRFGIISRSYGPFHLQHSGLIDERVHVGLTLLGVHQARHAVTSFDALIDRFVECVAFMVDLSTTHMPPIADITYPTITSEQLESFYRSCQVDDPAVVTRDVRRLMTRDLYSVFGSSSGLLDPPWTQEFHSAIRQFSGVTSAEQFVDRIVEQIRVTNQPAREASNDRGFGPIRKNVAGTVSDTEPTDREERATEARDEASDISNQTSASNSRGWKRLFQKKPSIEREADREQKRRSARATYEAERERERNTFVTVGLRDEFWPGEAHDYVARHGTFDSKVTVVPGPNSDQTTPFEVRAHVEPPNVVRVPPDTFVFVGDGLQLPENSAQRTVNAMSGVGSERQHSLQYLDGCRDPRTVTVVSKTHLMITATVRSAQGHPQTLPPDPENRPVVVLMTVNEHETQAVLEVFLGSNSPAPLIPRGGVTYQDFGIHGEVRVIGTISQMGSGSVGAAQQRTRDAIDHWKPRAVIAVGIGFGMDETKQSIGDVMVSTQVHSYEPERVNPVGPSTGRGAKADASDHLINRIRAIDANEKRKPNNWPTVRFGLLVSGEKLVDNVSFLESLKSHFPDAIGGDMEGAGLYTGTARGATHWVVVKGICDWAHGKNSTNKEESQKLAAKNAARVVKEALSDPPLYDNQE